MKRLVYAAFFLLDIWPAIATSQSVAPSCPTLPGTAMRDFSRPCTDTQGKTMPPAQPVKRFQNNSLSSEQTEGNPIHSNDSPAAGNLSVSECEAQIVANKSFLILKGKIDLLNTANQPLEILANAKVPSKKEKASIALWVEEQKRCSQIGIEHFWRQSPAFGVIFEQAYTEMFISAADLYQGKITYGDFARASVRRHQAVRGQLEAVVAQQRQQKAEKEQQEALARELEVQRQQEALMRQQEYEQQLQIQAQQQAQQQYQQQVQQRQYQQQQEEYAYQSCMNRARDHFAQSACNMERVGRGLGKTLGERLNK